MRGGLVLFNLLSTLPAVFGKGSTETDFALALTSKIVPAVIIAAVIIAYALYRSLHQPLSPKAKTTLFLAIVLPVVVVTAYIAGSTIYLNTLSVTNGPVHWHADVEIWKCGKYLDLIDPTGLSNRIGTPFFHEHGDQRLHVEGVVLAYQHVDLATFFAVIGGGMTNSFLSVPTNEGLAELQDGAFCGDQAAALQVFVYRVTNAHSGQRAGFTVIQEKLTSPADYVLSPFSFVPPGDCIIIELDAPKERTERICETYRVARDKGLLVMTDGS